ncbi:MAG: Mor transcription activator family protein [bacterium ADurb.Bin236]|nr:MAG: Mor transcription activator family protein [bacterium ADurb.Bin236]HOY61638.1 Mor transcription activator family protein [bacterium]
MSALKGIDIRVEDLTETYREVFDLLVEDLGENAVLTVIARLAEHYGGQQVYFQSQSSLTRAARDRAIKASHTGDPDQLRSIAREKQLSLPHIRRILSGG